MMKKFVLLLSLIVLVSGISSVVIAESVSLDTASGSGTVQSQPESATDTDSDSDELAEPENNQVKPDVVKTTPDVEDETVTPEFISSLSTYFGNSTEEVVKLNVDGIEQGELFFTLFIAQKSGKTAAEISTAKKAGKGWGEMVKEYNLGPGAHGRAMGKFRQGK